MRVYFEKLMSNDPALPVRCRLMQGGIAHTSHSSHWHEMMEIVYTRNGNATQQIAQTFYSVSTGDLSVICPNQLHSYTASSAVESFDLIVIQFDVEFVVGRVQTSGFYAKDWLSGCLFFPGPVKASPAAIRLIETIMDEMQTQQEGYIQVVTGALMELLVLLYRAPLVRLSAEERKLNNDQCRLLLSNTFQWICEHYQEEGLSVQQAAQNANLSISHFCRLFKQTTGVGFHEYLLKYRLSRAEQLFGTGQTLAEIAFSCGFGSLSAFVRAFKKWRGQPPGRTRRG